MMMMMITNLSLAPFCGTNSADPDKMSQNVAYDRGLHCLLTECSTKILIKMENTTQQPINWKWTGPIDNSGKFHSA